MIVLHMDYRFRRGRWRTGRQDSDTKLVGDSWLVLLLDIVRALVWLSRRGRGGQRSQKIAEELRGRMVSTFDDVESILKDFSVVSTIRFRNYMDVGVRSERG